MEPSLPRRPWWRRLRLTVRALMVLVLVVGGCLGWFIHRAAVQRDAVRAIAASGGTVRYDFQQTPWFLTPSKPPGPKWLVDLIGIDFFANVTYVSFRTSQKNAVVYTAPQTDAILADIGRLSRLEQLDANSVRVTDAGLAHLVGLSKLRLLSCQGTPGLTDTGLAHLAGLVRLEGLWIEGPTRIEGPGLAHLAGLDRLTSLCIHTETDAGWSSLSRLTGLRRLFINLPKVTGAALAQLSRLTRLEDLAFGGETGSDAEMAHLKTLTNLKNLQVYGPWFTDAGLAPVAEMDQLPTFFVSDETSVTDGGLNHLQRQRPTLRIGVNGSGRVPKARTNLLRAAVGPQAVRSGR